MSDTPETDAEHAQFAMGGFTMDFCRRMERERDEAREERDKLKQLLAADSENVDAYLGVCIERDEARTELEMWRDGNILHEIHRNELEKVERERDEAREEAHRFRALHYSHLGINGSASWFPWEDKLGHE